MRVFDDRVGGEVVRPYVPGYLLTPFGWAAQPIATFIAADSSLLADLFGLDRTRMHLVALVLAHVEVESPRELGRLLLRGSLREVLTQALGRCPTGARRALGRMPFKVLAVESYRQLTELLNDQRTAKLLFHADRIDNSTVKLLYEVPPMLRRPALLGLETCFHRLDGLTDGLRFLASRGVKPSLDALVRELASMNQPKQFVAKLKQMVNALPLPEAMPPVKVGPARRIDCPLEVQAIAKRWNNCLVAYISSINGGECAVYLWEEIDHAALSLVRRHGRFGWLLDDVKGPRNREIEPRRLERIRTVFADHGISQSSVIEAVESICDCRSLRRRRRARHLDEEALQEEDWDDEMF